MIGTRPMSIFPFDPEIRALNYQGDNKSTLGNHAGSASKATSLGDDLIG